MAQRNAFELLKFQRLAYPSPSLSVIDRHLYVEYILFSGDGAIVDIKRIPAIIVQLHVHAKHYGPSI